MSKIKKCIDNFIPHVHGQNHRDEIAEAMKESEDKIPERGDIVQSVERSEAIGKDAVWITLSGADGKDKIIICYLTKEKEYQLGSAPDML